MPKKKTIMVAPLHWGLGHATRCIPIIRALLYHDFNVLLASDGAALLLLQKEFPHLAYVELPSYNISYSKKGNQLKWKLLLKLPHIQKTINAEHTILNEIVSKGEIDGIISDSRFGIRNKAVPSVFITHQLNVLTGKTSYFSSKMHQRIIKKFDVCWVPDVEDEAINLSGKLGHLKTKLFPVKYIGILSRMVKKEIPKTIEILAILSGPEPQRSILEEKLKDTFLNSDKEILIVQGIVEAEQKWQQLKGITLVNFMQSEDLETTINKSNLIISRSGYTTIMDLTVLEKKVFFIPTPGQGEQEYLAERLKNLRLVPYCKQSEFTLKKLSQVFDYKGLKSLGSNSINYSELFSLFQGERKF